jgi:uncharacterized integral membrane protein
MESQSEPTVNLNNNSNSNGRNQNIIIGILIFLLVITFLGINLLNVGTNFMQAIYNIFGPIINQILHLLGFTAGTVISKTADVVSDAAKLGIDLSEGAVQNLGDLLIKSTKDEAPAIDKKINNAPPPPPHEPKPDNTENPIQKPPTAAKKSWCLVGEYQGRRGCIEITDQDKCISGQVFPEQKMCLNPTLTQNPTP